MVVQRKRHIRLGEHGRLGQGLKNLLPIAASNHFVVDGEVEAGGQNLAQLVTHARVPMLDDLVLGALHRFDEFFNGFAGSPRLCTVSIRGD